LNNNATSSSEETVRVIVREGSPLRRNETKRGGFVKEVCYNVLKWKRGRYGWAEWWNKRGRSDRWRNTWVGNRRTGAIMRLTKRWRQLFIPEA